ncbi:MAG: HAD family hydrolase [Candidatus Aminicenantes bacterium]|nr:HAD family hydrolase [Candidatus Aminicenantes bacterium]
MVNKRLEKKLKSPRLIFWDWTGTLADEAQLDRAICEEIEKFIALTKQISLSQAKELFQNYLKELEGQWEWHDYVRHSRHFNLPWKEIQKKHLDKLKLLPDAKEVLNWTKEKGYINILATNAVRAIIKLRLNHLKIEPFFDTLITSDDVQALKASGQHFKLGLNLYQAQPSKCFSIGDNPIQDINSARQLGLKTIHCRFGTNLTHYHTSHLTSNHQELVKADFSINQLIEVKNILERNNHG